MLLQKFGLPESLDRIDGAVRWGHNDKTYFFSGTITRKVRSAEKKSSFDTLQELCTGDLMRIFSLWSWIIQGIFKCGLGCLTTLMQYFNRKMEKHTFLRRNIPGSSMISK